MAFIRMKGIEGLVYVPEDEQSPKKHPCVDCYRCQWCSDNRCGLCLRQQPARNGSSPPDIIPMDSLDIKAR